MATGSRTKSGGRAKRAGAARRGVSGTAHVEARRLPRQDRAHATVEAILQAAAELFAKHGYARTTTNKIAVRAGVSVGSLYQYFPDKDAVLARLLEQHQQDVHRVLALSLGELTDPGVGLEDGVRRLLQRLVDLHLERPDLTRALGPDVLGQSRIGLHTHGEGVEFMDRVAVVLERRPDVRQGDHRAMAAVIEQASGTLTRWLIHEAPGRVDRAVLQEECVQLIVRYLASGGA
jgi:AcrR family transcriptional regulator